ncbi:unnamed protein product [Heterobilharzia americana]|nr:unnamed protein product [Heterobilharzia americana]
MLTVNHCCQNIGAPCTGTYVRHCCGKLRCEYDTLGFGICQKFSAAQTTVNFLFAFDHCIDHIIRKPTHIEVKSKFLANIKSFPSIYTNQTFKIDFFF